MHEEHSCSSEIQKLEEDRSRSRRTVEATLPNSQGLQNFITPVKMSATFDIFSSFCVLPNFSLCNSVLFCIF